MKSKREGYSEGKLREALRLAEGDEGRAVRLVLGWVGDDPELLLGLARPHLNGIVAYAVNRAARHVEQEPEPEPPPEMPDFDSLPGEAFGKELLKAVAFGQPTRFGREALAPNPLAPKKHGASRRHIDAIYQIATLSSQPKKDGK